MRASFRLPTRTLALLLATLVTTSIIGFQGTNALAAEGVHRSAGPDRIATAVAASRDHRDQASDALLANARVFPDALAATALAANLDAPLLLSENGTLPAAVGEELERLGVETVWILGGPSAVSWDVHGALLEQGYAVERVGGDNRYETARQLALEVGPAATGEVVVALGHHPEPDRAWPDAVAAGTLGASPSRLPILLTAHDELPAATREALDELAPDRVLLAGGTAAISDDVAAAITELGPAVERIAGSNRYETSVALAEDALERLDGDSSPVVFATGAGFPDALAAGALAGTLQAPLVLVPQSRLSDPVDAFLRERAERWSEGILLGGTAAATDFVAEGLQAALRDEPAPEREPEPEPEPAAESGAGEESEERVAGTFTGEASWYGDRFHGRTTASGETYDMHALTAAHRTLPFGTRVRVTNLSNGRQVTVRINDRGPFVGGRVIDLSRAAASEIGMISSGVAQVRGEILAD